MRSDSPSRRRFIAWTSLANGARPKLNVRSGLDEFPKMMNGRHTSLSAWGPAGPPGWDGLGEGVSPGFGLLGVLLGFGFVVLVGVEFIVGILGGVEFIDILGGVEFNVIVIVGIEFNVIVIVGVEFNVILDVVEFIVLVIDVQFIDAIVIVMVLVIIIRIIMTIVVVLS